MTEPNRDRIEVYFIIGGKSSRMTMYLDDNNPHKAIKTMGRNLKPTYNRIMIQEKNNERQSSIREQSQGDNDPQPGIEAGKDQIAD